MPTYYILFNYFQCKTSTLREPIYMHHLHNLLLTCHPYTDLSSDSTVFSHLTALYNALLQKNLPSIVGLYSVVEIDYVVKQARTAGC